MRKLNNVKCGIFVLTLFVGCSNALANKAQLNENSVSAITLDVLRLEACINDTDECLIAGGPKQMNLLDLAAGKVDFDKQFLLPDNTTELRLILGNKNTITVNGESFALTVPSGQTSGLKLKGENVFTEKGGILTSIALNFDLGKMLVVQEKNGTDASYLYSLKPVIQVASADIAPLPEYMVTGVAEPNKDVTLTLGDDSSILIPAGAVVKPTLITSVGVTQLKFEIQLLQRVEFQRYGSPVERNQRVANPTA